MVNDGGEEQVLPFLKWAGGKRWLVANHLDLFPKNYNRYIEPFLGSGAAFFRMAPRKAILADTNVELIETYKAIRDDWRKVEVALRRHHRSHSPAFYYQERGRRRRSAAEKAAQFIYLNRTCWNGLYRVNLRGEFNVPIGTKTSVVLDTDDFESTSALLRRAKLIASDFEKTIALAEEGDFLFVDPPYTANHNLNGFLKYNEKIFSWADQLRLKACLVDAAARGANILLTNANHRTVRKLYADFGTPITISRASVLAGDPTYRGRASELVVRTWVYER